MARRGYSTTELILIAAGLYFIGYKYVAARKKKKQIEETP